MAAAGGGGESSKQVLLWRSMHFREGASLYLILMGTRQVKPKRVI